MEILRTLGIPIGTLIVGYLLGTYKAFREAKQKAYTELLPPILKVAYRSDPDEGEFCEALCKLWLYGSRKVTKMMDHAVWIVNKPAERGDMTTALQEVIVEMRKDIQFWRRWQSIKPADVKHIFTRIRQVRIEQNDTGSKTTE